MAQLGLFLWALLFIILGFSMMPWCMTLVMVVSFVGGFIDGMTRNKRKRKSRKADFKLNSWERRF